MVILQEKIGFNSTYEIMKLLIEKTLIDAGANTTAKGFKYAVYGIELLLNYVNLREETMMLYEEISKAYGVRALNVERCIRYLKENTKYKKYTTSMFLSVMSINVKEAILEKYRIDLG